MSPFGENERDPRLEHKARAPIPTRYGTFDLHVFNWEDADAHPALSREHCALVMGDVRGQRAIPWDRSAQV